MALSTLNSSLESLGDPSSTTNPGEPKSVFLTDFRIDGNSWKCDCGIGWIETWMKLWRGASCGEHPPASDCEGALRSLRKATCVSNARKSIMEALKKDLECGTTSASTSLHSHALKTNWTHLFVLIVPLMGTFTRNLA